MLVVRWLTVGRRWLSFSLVGLGVMLAGAFLLTVLADLCRLNQSLAYAIQTFFSIEANFIFNYRLTWSDREITFLPVWLKFHSLKIITVLLNQLLFAALVTLGLQHLLAYFCCIATVTILNFITGDKYIFRSSHRLK